MSQSEYSVATVVTVNDDGAWLTWHQEEYDLGNMYFREYEDYTCQEVSVSGKYCHRWIGNIDSEEEFEYSTCECQDDNVAGLLTSLTRSHFNKLLDNTN